MATPPGLKRCSPRSSSRTPFRRAARSSPAPWPEPLPAAWLVRRDFVSIGASTAVFGALGALAAFPQHRRRAWVPLGAGLALLAFLGTSKRADLAGHLCGFVAGLLLGAVASRLPPLRSR